MAGKTLYLVRHGQTEWNAERRMQGQMDSPLTPLGQEQARQHGHFLARGRVDHLYASPLGRVRQTVAAIRETIEQEPRFDDRLMEWHSGDWSGYLHTELQEMDPQGYAAWEENRFTHRVPGGETYGDMIARAADFLGEMDAETGPGQHIAIVCHGVIARCLAHVVLGLKPEETIAIRQPNDMIFRLVETGQGWKASHFIGGEGPRPGIPRHGGAEIAI